MCFSFLPWYDCRGKDRSLDVGDGVPLVPTVQAGVTAGGDGPICSRVAGRARLVDDAIWSGLALWAWLVCHGFIYLSGALVAFLLGLPKSGDAAQ